MGTVLVGKAPLTTIRHTSGSRSNLPAGVIVPGSIDPRDAERLLAEGYLVELEVAEPEDTGDQVIEAVVLEPEGATLTDGGRTKPATIAEVQAIVGNDPEKAQAFLEAERAATKPRPKLVAALEKIVDDADVARILDEVGTDPERATAYLDAEERADKPRPALIAALEKVVDDAVAAGWEPAGDPGASDPEQGAGS